MKHASLVVLAVYVILLSLCASVQSQVSFQSNGASPAPRLPRGLSPGSGRATKTSKSVASGVNAASQAWQLNFATPALYGSGGSGGAFYSGSIAVADLNGDGKPDIVSEQSTTDGTIQVGVLLNNGDGTFQTAVTYGAGGSSSGLVYTSVVVADVNGEGKPDIVVGNDPGSIGVLFALRPSLIALQNFNESRTFPGSLSRTLFLRVGNVEAA